MKKITLSLLYGMLCFPVLVWAGDNDYYRYTLEQGKDLLVTAGCKLIQSAD